MARRGRGAAADPEMGDVAASILAEARIVGLRSLQQPSLADVQRRRGEVHIIAILAVVGGAAGLFFTHWRRTDALVSPAILRDVLLAVLAGGAAYVIEKERHLRRLMTLLMDERVLTTALSDRVHEIGALLDAAAAVNSAHELDTVLDIILSSALALLGGTGGTILRREGDDLVAVCSHGGGMRIGSRVAIGEGAAGRAARIREALLLTGQQSDDSDEVGAARRRKRGEDSVLAAPMLDSGEVLGVLVVQARAGRTLSEYDLRAANLFASSAASAVTKAELLATARAHASKLEHAAYHDSLTGLANRTLLVQHIEESLARTRAGAGLTALLYIDLDGFKTVNDRLGHTSGDELLTAFGERLRGCLRAGAHAARLGGDEFAVLLSGVDDVAVATVVARRILAAVNRPYSLQGHEAAATASIGIAVVDEGDIEATWETLINRSDVAMYDAKRKARGSFRVFDSSALPYQRVMS